MNKIDLTWDDSEVLPDKMRPDIEFLFKRMNEATFAMVDARRSERILDVGCGRATDIVSLSKSGAIMIGLEPSFKMLSHCRESLKLDGQTTSVLQAIGESIPVVPGSIDKVICKGALDHFADPGLALQQMADAIKPGGSVIIAIANFESLGFKIGKFIFWLRKMLGIRNPYKRLPWELPPDHTVKFDYRLTLDMLHRYLKVDKVTGISMLCSTPGWGDMLGRLPRKMSDAVLKLLDDVSGALPCLSDVLIIRCIRNQPD